MREPLPEHYKPIIIVVLCTALLLLGISLYQTTQDGGSSTQTPDASSPSETSHQINPAAVASELSPEGFPLQFVIDEEVKENKAYTLTYTSDSHDQMTVRYSTERTPTEALAAFMEILNAQLWTVIDQNESAFLASVYGVKDNREVSIVAEPHGASRESIVIVSIVNKPTP
jgi:hypothetical protein